MDIETLVDEFRTELPWQLSCSSTVAKSSAYSVRLFLRNQTVPFPECVTYQRIVAWLDHLAATPPRHRNKPKREASTVNGHLKALKRFTRWCVSRNHIETDPIAGLKGLPEQDRVIMAPKVETVATLLSVAKGFGSTPEMQARNFALICTLIDNGPRVGELVQMNVQDVIDESGNLRKHCVIHGKGGKDRLMAMQPLVRTALEAYLPVRRARPDEHALWVTETGDRMVYSAFRNTLRRLCKKAGVSVNLHDFRRFAITNMWLDGIDQVSGMTLSGHTDVDVYMRYLRGGIAERALDKHEDHSPLEKVLSGGAIEPVASD